MNGRILALAALLCAPATAQADSGSSEWAGVYRGTIGPYPVMACLDSAGYNQAGTGSYYYLKHLKPIPLLAEVAPGAWRERADGTPWDSKDGPIWTVTKAGKAGLTGTWSHKGKTLPIRMKSVPLASENPWRICADGAFYAPRVEPARFERQADRLGDFAFTRMIYQTPRQFAGSVAIAGFTYEPSRPGDARIIAELTGRLPKGTVDDEFIQCLGGAMGNRGSDGDYEEELVPHFASAAFLDVQVTMSDYCGGAYPNFGIWHRVFDRDTGEEVELSTWLSERAVRKTEYDSTEATEDLRTLAVSRWPDDVDPECKDSALEQSSWHFGLAPGGLWVSPSFPHVAAACETPVVVPWGEIEPYLSDAGRKGLARLR